MKKDWKTSVKGVEMVPFDTIRLYVYLPSSVHKMEYDAWLSNMMSSSIWETEYNSDGLGVAVRKESKIIGHWDDRRRYRGRTHFHW